MRSKHHSAFPKSGRRQSRTRDIPALEWMEDISGKTARTTAIGSRSLIVENHAGILAFSENQILLNTGCGPLEIKGTGMYLQDVRADALIIHGEIHRVDLPCEGGHPHEG